MSYINDFAQPMTVALAVLGCIITITAGHVSDKTKRYGLSVCVLAILGYVLMISTHNSHMQYPGAFLVVSGSVYSVTISFLLNN